MRVLEQADERRSTAPRPTDTDFDQFQTALEAHGLDAIEIGALLDGKAPDPPLPDDRMCQAGRSYLDVLHGLPDDPAPENLCRLPSS